MVALRRAVVHQAPARLRVGGGRLSGAARSKAPQLPGGGVSALERWPGGSTLLAAERPQRAAGLDRRHAGPDRQIDALLFLDRQLDRPELGGGLQRAPIPAESVCVASFDQGADCQADRHPQHMARDGSRWL